MLASRFDDLAYRKKSVSLFCSRALKKIFDTKIYEDIIFTVLITLACGFYQYEAFLPYSGEISVLLTVAASLIWVWVSAVNGFLKRGPFIIFMLVYWMVPHSLIFLFGETPIASYNALLDTAAQAAVIFCRAPMRVYSEMTELDPFIITVVFTVICEVFFTVGYIIRKNAPESNWYCKFRVHYEMDEL